MRVLLRGGFSFLIAASFMVVASASRADELLVMPYSCSVSGGEPVLIPSADKGYRIIGGREQREFSACSPADPTKCRSWTVHRFDIDCSGARVPWTAVVAAADGHRRARFEGGRLLVRMPWTWALPQGDPCARLSEFDRRRPRFRRLARRCGFRKARAPDSIVEMPQGFAPKFGIDAIFVAGVPPQAPSVSVADPAAAVPRVAPEEVRIETPPLPPRLSLSQRRAATKDTPTNALPANAQAKAPAESRPADVKAASVSAGSPASPTIINRRDSDAGDTPVRARTDLDPDETASLAAADVATAKSDDGETLAMVQSAPAENEQTTQASQNQSEASASGLVAYLRDPMTVAISALALLSAILIAGFVLMRRHDASQARVVTSRDIGSVWLDESRGRVDASSALIVTKENGARPERSAPARISTPSWGDTVPQTREDALRVLGVGVSYDANQTAIKKVVDGLRMSWHPDHAEGEDDRRVRELRLKQINVAWEIISEARAEQRA